MFQRILLILVAVGTLALVAASVAVASPPIRFSDDVSGSFTADCGSFDLLVEFEGKEIVMLFADTEGDLTRVLIAAPAAMASVTNLDTGDSMDFTITGPGHVDVTPEGDSVRLVGPWLLDAHPETGEEGGLFFATGQLSFMADETGISDVSFRGRFVDVCAMFAT